MAHSQCTWEYRKTDMILTWGKGVKYLRQVTFRTLLSSTMCVVRVTWPRPGASRPPEKTTSVGESPFLDQPHQGKFSASTCCLGS